MPGRIMITTEPRTIGTEEESQPRVLATHDLGRALKIRAERSERPLASVMPGKAPHFIQINTHPSDPNTILPLCHRISSAIFVSHDEGGPGPPSSQPPKAGRTKAASIRFQQLPPPRSELVPHPVQRELVSESSRAVPRKYQWNNLASRKFPGPGLQYRTRGMENTVVASMALHPLDPNLILLGIVDVGMLRSEDGGTSFAQIKSPITSRFGAGSSSPLFLTRSIPSVGISATVTTNGECEAGS